MKAERKAVITTDRMVRGQSDKQTKIREDSQTNRKID
jgi:hypothetical protein